MSDPVKFSTVGGKTVTWTPDEAHPTWGDYTCDGCKLTRLRDARREHADEHAATCRVV
ncbi:hypothetical protein [Sphaerisporangium rhizosphaerae]|uniref:Uncharacterized protein n=1 Tax=Sphaerisporangium rhizosphaerae TaxID=2269375 RepID=A0ABW2P3S2_9ACTN